MAQVNGNIILNGKRGSVSGELRAIGVRNHPENVPLGSSITVNGNSYGPLEIEDNVPDILHIIFALKTSDGKEIIAEDKMKPNIREVSGFALHFNF